MSSWEKSVFSHGAIERIGAGPLAGYRVAETQSVAAEHGGVAYAHRGPLASQRDLPA